MTRSRRLLCNTENRPIRKNNPACFECPKNANGIHFWRRDPQTRKAMCENCDLQLNNEDSADLYGDLSPR